MGNQTLLECPPRLRCHRLIQSPVAVSRLAAGRHHHRRLWQPQRLPPLYLFFDACAVVPLDKQRRHSGYVCIGDTTTFTGGACCVADYRINVEASSDFVV